MMYVITIPWEYAQLYSAIMLLIWLTPLLFLARKTAAIAEYTNNEMDEVDLIFSNHEMAKSWWRSFLAWIGLTILWVV